MKTNHSISWALASTIFILSFSNCNHCDQKLISQNDSLKKVIKSLAQNSCQPAKVLPLTQMLDTLGKYLNSGIPQNVPAVKMSKVDLMDEIKNVSQDSLLAVLLDDKTNGLSLELEQDSAGTYKLLYKQCQCPGMPPPWCPDTTTLRFLCNK